MEHSEPTSLPENYTTPPRVPSRKAQSLGAIISIVIIVLMVIIGAFYAWSNRIAQENKFNAQTTMQK